MRVEFVELLQDMLSDLEGNPEPVEVKLLGPDAQALRAFAPQVAAQAISVLKGDTSGDGTSADAFQDWYSNGGSEVAGKTGTAQVNAPRQATSVFTSFAPASNPTYVVDAFVEDAGYGASVAAPVVREIYDQLFNVPLQPVAYSNGGSGGQN